MPAPTRRRYRAELVLVLTGREPDPGVRRRTVRTGMATRRSLKFVLAVLIAGLGAGTTFAWAGVLIGGHRADHIGTFAPATSNVVAPVGPADPASVSTTTSAAPRTTIGTTTRPPADDKNERAVEDD
jgi:hypothetical protein